MDRTHEQSRMKVGRTENWGLYPGQMHATLIPSSSSAGLRLLVNATRAAFVALYNGTGYMGYNAATEAITITTPFLFLLSSARMAMRVSLIGWRLMSTSGYRSGSLSAQNDAVG